MQITVFGANGKVGRLVVRKLLDEGHDVIAFIHRHSNLSEHPGLTLVRGDIHDGHDVGQALQGSNAVISTLGSWHTREKNILSSAVERLVPAMRTAGISRIISVTGAGAFTAQDTPNLFDTTQHVLLNTIAPKVLRDGEEHIRLLAESGLDWTVVRSPVMNESGGSAYQLGDHFPLPWQTIRRQAVVDCLVAQLNDTSRYGEAPFITRS
ncbi:MAG: NAD(P)-binding oxidoreductase [Candidatus Saccharimonadales bacterium]